jgi:hypothetical protein
VEEEEEEEEEVRKEISSLTKYFTANGSVNLPMTSALHQMMANETKDVDLPIRKICICIKKMHLVGNILSYYFNIIHYRQVVQATPWLPLLPSLSH